MMHSNRTLHALLVFLLLLPTSAWAQSVLVFDDTNTAFEAELAGEALGYDVRTERAVAPFRTALTSGDAYDIIVVDVRTQLLPGDVVSLMEDFADAGTLFIIGYADMENNAGLRDLAEIDCSGDLSAPQPLVAAAGSPLDFFNVRETLPATLAVTTRGGDAGDRCTARGESAVLAAMTTAGGDDGVFTSANEQFMVNNVAMDSFRGRDADSDGTDDLVELYINEFVALDLLQTPQVITLTDGPTPTLDAFLAAYESEAVPVADLAELDALLIESTNFAAAYFEFSDLSAVDAGIVDRIDTLRGLDIPVLFFTSDFDGAPAIATALGVNTSDSSDTAEGIFPGPAGLERAIFRSPETFDSMLVGTDGAGDSLDSLDAPYAGFHVLGRFGSDTGDAALIGATDGNLIIGSFLLSEVGAADSDGDSVADGAEFINNAIDFANTIGPVAVLFSDADAAGVESIMTQVALGEGYYPLVTTSGDEFDAALGVTTTDVVLIENLANTGSELDAIADGTELASYLDAGGTLLVQAVDLDGAPSMTAFLGVEFENDIFVPAAIVQNEANLARVFAFPSAIPTRYAVDPDVVVLDYGDSVSVAPTALGSTVANFEVTAPAVPPPGGTLLLGNSQIMLNTFSTATTGLEDTNGDRVADIVEFFGNQLYALDNPQSAIVLDDDTAFVTDESDVTTSVVGRGAVATGLRAVVTTNAADFAATYDAGTWQQMVVDASATDVLTDADATDRITEWASNNGGLVLFYNDFDGNAVISDFFGVTPIDLTTFTSLTAPATDLVQLFSSPTIVPNPITAGTALYTDLGDAFATAPTDPNVGARFNFNLGPTATVLALGGTSVVSGFAPRTLANSDLDGNGVEDRVALVTNMLTRTGRVPVPVFTPPTEIDEGTTVSLDASDSFDPFGEALSFAWDLDGDGEYDDATGPVTDFDARTLDGDSVSTTVTIGLQITNESDLTATIVFEALVNNVAPTINAGPDREVDQGTVATFNVTINDVPDDTFDVSWDFGDGEGTDTGQMVMYEYDIVGEYTVTVTVTDDDGGTSVDSFVVDYVNVAPLIDPGVYDPVDEGSEFTLTVTGEDPGDDAFTVTWDFGDDSATAEGLSVDHTYADNGTYTISATATEDIDTASTRTVTTSIAVRNVAPTVVSTPPPFATAGVEYTYDVEVTDPGDDTFTFELLDGPSDMTIDPVTGEISWTPGSSGFADVSVNVLVTDDDGGFVEHPFDITLNFDDTDEGGAPDSCEEAFGYDPSDGADDLSDDDGDGLTLAEECISGRDPSVFSGPDAPTLVSPIDNASWFLEEVELVVTNVDDPDGDAITYEFQIFEDDELTELFTESLGIEEGDFDDQTRAYFIEDWDEDFVYCWRARAVADDVDGPWSESACFVFNRNNAAPGRPTAVSPTGVSDTRTPELRLGNATDPEGEALVYIFELYEGTNTRDVEPIAISDEIPQQEGGETSWTPPYTDGDTPIGELTEDQVYTWRARARDTGRPRRTGPYAVATFNIDSENLSPSTPIPVFPIEGETVAFDSEPTFEWRRADDPDGDSVTYTLDLATDSDFEDIVLNVPTITSTTDGNITFVATNYDYEPLTTYYWRIAASDGNFTTPYSFTNFVTDEANLPPGRPTPLDPILGAEVVANSDNTLEFTFDNATDPNEADLITYDIQIANTQNISPVLLSATGIRADASGTTTAVVTDEFLSLNFGLVFWRVRAYDGQEYGAWSDPVAFRYLQSSSGGDDVGVDGGSDAGGGDANIDDDATSGADAGGGGGSRSDALGGGGGCSAAPSSSGTWAFALVALGLVARRRRS